MVLVHGATRRGKQGCTTEQVMLRFITNADWVTPQWWTGPVGTTAITKKLNLLLTLNVLTNERAIVRLR